MLKTTIQKIFSFFGLKIVRIRHYVDPIAPFNVLELAILRQISEDNGNFYFLKIGADCRALLDTFEQLRRKHSLPGCVVPSDIDLDTQSFQKFISTLPQKKISVLHISSEGGTEKAISTILDSGIFPEVINFDWTSISDENRFTLKMKLLDNRYRFIDVGADTVCVRDKLE